MLFDATLLDYFPLVSDELAYYQQIATFVRAGFNGGYFCFYEMPAPLASTHFSVHGPAFPVMYGLLGRLVGWRLHSGPIFNLAALAAATALFIAMTRPSRGQIVATGIVILTSWWTLLMATITMQETLNQAFMVVVAAFAARLLHPDTRRHNAVLLVALAVLVVASLLRPTNWIVAVPLVFVGMPRRPLLVRALAALVAGCGIPVFWLIWRYISAPIPGLAIELTGATSTGAIERVWSYFFSQISRNASSIFDIKSFVAQPFLQHVMFETAAIAAISAVFVVVASVKAVAARHSIPPQTALWDKLPFSVDLFNLLALGITLVAFLGFYFDSEASISRVTAPFLLLSLLLLVATRCRRFVLAMAVVANLPVAPSFLAVYRAWRTDLFTYDRDRFELFRGQVSPLLTFDPGKGPWCNTLLTMSYAREIVGVPAGIGLSVGTPPDAVAAPVKSRYLLLTNDGFEQYKHKARLEHLESTVLGELYVNLNAACEDTGLNR